MEGRFEILIIKNENSILLNLCVQSEDFCEIFWGHLGSILETKKNKIFIRNYQKLNQLKNFCHLTHNWPISRSRLIEGNDNFF